MVDRVIQVQPLVRRFGVPALVGMILLALFLDVVLRPEPIGVDFHTYAAASLVGVYDFGAFGSAPRPGGTTVRTVHDATVTTHRAGGLEMVIVAPQELRGEIESTLSNEAREAVVGWAQVSGSGGGTYGGPAVTDDLSAVLDGLHLTKRLNKDAVGTRATYRGRG